MKNGSIFQGVRKMKTKKIFTARITADDELLAMLGLDRIGGHGIMVPDEPGRFLFSLSVCSGSE